jgi:hypothetical protein
MWGSEGIKICRPEKSEISPPTFSIGDTTDEAKAGTIPGGRRAVDQSPQCHRVVLVYASILLFDKRPVLITLAGN